jgi:hypothetical protein
MQLTFHCHNNRADADVDEEEDDFSFDGKIGEKRNITVRQR